MLRIQEGCDEHCTFCATTLARGANRSRSAEDLVVVFMAHAPGPIRYYHRQLLHALVNQALE